jgi:hypothetical protein
MSHGLLEKILCFGFLISAPLAEIEPFGSIPSQPTSHSLPANPILCKIIWKTIAILDTALLLDPEFSLN